MTRQPTPSERLRELEAQSHRGRDGIVPIAAALNDRCITVRVEAARLLGQIGGPAEAVRLQEALFRAFRQRSPLGYRILGWVRVGGLGLAVGVMIVVIGILSLGQAFKLKDVKPGKIWSDIVGFQRGEEPFVRACVEAIAAIAERAPTPESRRFLDQLHALANDEVHLAPATRTAIAASAERLDAATRRLAELPVPSEAEPPRVNELPVPAGEASQPLTAGG